MAIYYARKSGNVNASDVWATTPTGVAGDYFSSFTNQDTLMANSFTVTLNVNTTVLQIRNDTTGGATQGGIFALSDGTTLTANIYAGNAASHCVTYGGSISAAIVGSLNGGNNNSNYGALWMSGAGTLSITGSVISTGASSGILYQSAGILNITGSVVSNGGYGMYVTSGGTNPITIIGNVGGGTGSVATIQHQALNSIIIIGTALGGNIGVGVNNSSTGTVIITRAKGNNFGPGSVGVSAAVGASNSQTGTMKVYEIEYGDLGQSPTSGPIELVTANSNVAVFAVRFSTKKTLVDLNNATNLIPASGNVRSGVSYNYGNNVGSCVIPNPNSVVYGVPVDNTVGSGLLSPVAVWNALTSAIGTSGSIGERLKNCSTVSTVGKQLEGVL